VAVIYFLVFSMFCIVKRFNCRNLVNLSCLYVVVPRNTVVLTSKSLWCFVRECHGHTAKGENFVLLVYYRSRNDVILTR